MKGCVIFLFGVATSILGWYAHAEYLTYKEHLTQLKAVQERILFLEAEQLENRCRLLKLEKP